MAADWSSARASPLRRVGGAVVRALHTPFRAAGRGIRRFTHAHGAGESGLGKLIELHAVNGAGDMLITIALASTVFFSVPTDEARGRVALYLAVTLAPFAVLAPVVGPILDHFPHGRRAAMAGSMLTRAVLALLLSHIVTTGGIALYPAALGVLVASKAYGVVRSAVVPRLLPPRFALVKANSRVTLSGLLATGIAAPVGAVLQSIGSGWPLYGAFLVFCCGAFLAFTLPHKVDMAKGEAKARFLSHEHTHAHGLGHGLGLGHGHGLTHGPRTSDPGAAQPSPARTAPSRGTSASATVGSAPGGAPRTGTPGTDTAHAEAAPYGSAPFGLGRRRNRAGQARAKRPGLRTVGPSVLHGLQANATHRALSGFLIFFLAFLLREHPLDGQSAAFSLGIVGAAAGTGNALGTAVGAWLKSRTPEKIIVSVLILALGTAVLATVFFGTLTIAALGAAAGFTQALSKLSLDAMIQRDVPEQVRTSAFARSETLLQMAWVVGGAIGISLPLNGTLGMFAACLMLGAGALASVRGLLAAAHRGASRPRVT